MVCRNVQVTLQILAALIEKSPKDLPLVAPCVLKILDQILCSRDITMVESSVPTFETFCEHHDASALLADQAYLRQYESVVRQYAALASTRFYPDKPQLSKPVSMRWRNAGLEAIKSVASSDALSSVSGGHYDVIVPMILENLWTDNEEFLEVLLQRAETEEKAEPALLIRRRTSVATVRTADTGGDTNPIAFSGTAVDVDKLAEEDIGVLAMQCLKQIFVVPNRSQIHAGAVALLRFTLERVDQGETVVKTSPGCGKDGGWAVKVFSMISRWAPVQDRYTILLTALDTLAGMPLLDKTLLRHIVLTTMIGSLLRSDVNLIGLSVMDVLLQLLAHMKRLVQMPGDPSITAKTDPAPPGKSDRRSPTAAQSADNAEKLALQRRELLHRLQRCIGDLATHVYYADQISDIISTVLLKLRPARHASTTNSSPRGERAEGEASSNSPAPTDDQHADSLFTLSVAKIAALRAIKSVLLVANPRTKMAGNVNLSRNRVPVQVWDGTQWLLRDPDGQVRKAYADAVLTWLDRETTKADLRMKEDSPSQNQRPSTRSRELLGAGFGRRVVSSASNRDRPVKTPRSRFIMLLHVAIYDNALQYVDYEVDIIMLHVLLAKLVKQLGINAVRYGLPMIFRLQEDIQEAETPASKVRIGGLCHGYFWTLSDIFDFEASVVGRAIHNEIIRRRTKHFWVDGIHVPPPLLDLIGTPGVARPQPKLPLKEVESEALLPFDDRYSLVECVCASYQEMTSISPPASPPASPGRTFAHPVGGSPAGTIPTIETEYEVPPHLREQMLSEWSREAVIAAVQEESKSVSLNGSRTGTSGTGRHRLAVNGSAAANGHRWPSPTESHRLRPSSSPVAGNHIQLLQQRKASMRSNASPVPDSNPMGARGAVTSVDRLKLALSGDIQPPQTGRHTVIDVQRDDGSSDSLASYDMAPSELSFNTAAAEPTTPTVNNSKGLSRFPSQSQDRRSSELGGPLSSHPTREVDAYGPEEDVPPVPPLPSGLERRGSTAIAAETPLPPSRPTTSRRSALRSRGGDSVASSSWAVPGEVSPTMDLNSLLQGINSRAGEHGLGNVSKPPY